MLPEIPIILDPERSSTHFLTLSSYRNWSQRLAYGLQNAGFQVGDRLFFLSGNTIAWPIVFMGTLMAGGILSGASPAWNLPKLTRQAAEVDSAFIFTSAESYSTACRIASAISLDHTRVFLFDEECCFTGTTPGGQSEMQCQRHWQDLIKIPDVPFDWTPFAGSNQIAAINYTSGSTGDAKGVMVSHYNLIANAIQFIEQQRHDPLSPENGHPMTWVTWTPMYHVIGQTQYCITAPKRGIKNYIMKKYELETWLKYIVSYKVSTMLLIPPILISMLHHPAMKQYDLSSVRYVSVGGAPLRESVSERFKELMPNESLAIRQGWGMTEY